MPADRQHIVYLHGPGDAGGTLKKWAEGAADGRIIADAYSIQFFEVCHELGCSSTVFVDRPHAEPVERDPFKLYYEPFIPKSRGIRYIRDWFAAADALASRIADLGTDAVFMSIHYGFPMIAALAKRSIPVVLTLHNTLWPMSTTPRLADRVVRTLTRRTASTTVRAALSVVPEATRQLRATLPGDYPIIEHVPQYSDMQNDLRAAPFGQPFHVIFAGRLERMKGVRTMIETAAMLRDARASDPSKPEVRWTIAGDGAELDWLRTAVAERNLTDVVSLPGWIGGEELTDIYKTTHVTVTPTERSFNEGIAKSSLESMLFGMPAIVTEVVASAEVMQGACIVVPVAEGAAGLARAITDLATDQPRYDAMCAAALERRADLFKPERSFANGLRTALPLALGR